MVKILLFKIIDRVLIFDLSLDLSDSYSENVDLARITANLEEVVSRIIDDEEKKRKTQPMNKQH